MAVAGWIPGLLPWLCDNSNYPGMKNLRRNKVEAHTVARELLDSKRRELEAGTPSEDLMSLLGSLPPFFASVHVVVEGFSVPVKANDSQSEGLKLTDEEVISQVRWELYLRVTLTFALITYRSFMLAGHETTAKAVGTFPSAQFPFNVSPCIL